MKEKLISVIEVAKELFDRKLVNGMTGNISFRDNEFINITKSGTCFKYLDEESFAKISLNGNIIEGNPSKEYPLHLELYKNIENINCVIHTHSFNSVLMSMLKNIDVEKKELFSYTPYLKIKVKSHIGIVDYFNPGSSELFENFSKIVNTNCNVYLLKNHGLIVRGKDVLEVFDIIEEFEQTCKTLISIKQYNDNNFEKMNKY